MINRLLIISIKRAKTCKGETSLFELTLGQAFPPPDFPDKKTQVGSKGFQSILKEVGIYLSSSKNLKLDLTQNRPSAKIFQRIYH